MFIQNKTRAQGTTLLKVTSEFQKKEERVVELVSELDQQIREKSAKVCGFRARQMIIQWILIIKSCRIEQIALVISNATSAIEVLEVTRITLTVSS